MFAFNHPRRDWFAGNACRTPRWTSFRALFGVKTRRAAIAGLNDRGGKPALAARDAQN
jgi:hypothetical protein